MTLENKLGLTNFAELAREEEKLSKKKALALFENGILNQLEAVVLCQDFGQLKYKNFQFLV